MARSRRRKCKHCRELFIPDHRNRNKQRYCSKPECRVASKAAAQEKWLQKEENKNYFRGPDNVRRVQAWREHNPGYRQKQRLRRNALQDHSSGNNKRKQEDKPKLTKEPLQDLLTSYPIVLVGLLAHFSGSLLQDDIVHTGLRLQQLGRDILTEPSIDKGGRHDSRKTTHTSAHDPQGAGTVQLAGSPPGP
ncbi:hypothetical protein [Desulfopila sp. IMCC35008]|uniref:hypothetical protein n=1 Tax=Desulfopila sp. IMCC35008 TaxID=2653858 RepID=UPI00197AF786|nr:hypothetical protein [Desulfopila sp. IMCC35008]